MRVSGALGGLRWPTVVMLVAVLTAGTTGCEGLGTDEASVGGGLPTLAADELVEGAAVQFEGVIEVLAEGCMRVRVDSPSGDTTARWVVWPEGTELFAPDTPDPSSARLGGELFSDHDRVRGTAQLVSLAQLPFGASPGSFYNGKGRYCRAQETGVIVIKQIQHAG